MVLYRGKPGATTTTVIEMIFFFTGTLPNHIKEYYEEMASMRRLTEPEKLWRLLGCTFGRNSHENGEVSICMVHQKEIFGKWRQLSVISTMIE